MQDDSLIHDFLSEADEILDRLDLVLIEMEDLFNENGHEDETMERIHGLFRGVHTIKGVAGSLGFNQFVVVTHEGEALLDALRKDKIALSSSHIVLFFDLAKLLRTMLTTLKDTGEDGGHEEEIQAMALTLHKALSGPPQAPANPTEGPPAEAFTFVPTGEAKLSEIPTHAEALIQILQNTREGVENEKQWEKLQQLALQLDHHASKSPSPEIRLLVHRLAQAAKKVGRLNHEASQNMVGIMFRALQSLLETVRCTKPTESHYEMLARQESLLSRLINRGEAAGENVFLGKILVEDGFISQATLDQALSKQGQPLGRILMDMKALSETDLRKALKVQRNRKKQGDASTGDTRQNERQVRVHVEKLERLGNLVGELVISENALIHHPSLKSSDAEDLRRATIQMSQLIRELQEISMSLRMVPVLATFQKLKLVARETSRQLNKKVNVVLGGTDVELDRTILDHLYQPLVHMVRNAVDHGIETPAKRTENGKPEVGTFTISAHQSGGEIHILLEDDGGGINPEIILNKAKETGVLPEPAPTRPGDIFALIFRPGFSTSEKVTNISGRGVGMDVVHRAITGLNGNVDIESELGRFSRFRIRIPLTLSIIEGMLVRVGDLHLTIPIPAVRETMVCKKDQFVPDIDRNTMLLIRGELVPTIPLGTLFGVKDEAACYESGLVIVVYSSHGCRGLLVDRVIGQQQTVIKSVPTYLGKLPWVSGFSVLSTGAISQVLDSERIISEY
ncbi:chemotaxis protein CheA [Acanthopleuribacter pedis]|uniref:histidine kinase n=1 Tax=Acanthopleuribacter pedis TaxID=442870 RepID=A0A8J7Q5I6_9BACT|nr:chemotaxis protein CheA [Acanthopleuribacter pedis]MBO1320812.1 chemotaxis protein CheA [Acanthopleuribacter pedis]